MSTDSGDELNLWHFHCRNRLCMTTGTSITVDDLRHVIDNTAPVVAHDGHAPTCPEFNELSALENYRTCTTNVDHLINVLQMENHYGKRTKGICICATTGMTTTLSKHGCDELHCGNSTVSHRQQRRICWTCTTGTSTTWKYTATA